MGSDRTGRGPGRDDDPDPWLDGLGDAEAVALGAHGGQDESAPRRTRLLALAGLATVVVLATVVIVLVSLFVHTTSDPTTPRAAAQRWVGAVLRGDRTGRRMLECTAGSRKGDVLERILPSASDATAGPARRTGSHRWQVPLTLSTAGGAAGTAVAITVVRQGGRYVVC